MIAAFSLAACSGGADPADLVASDVAFKGVEADGGLQPVAAKAVRIGIQGKDQPACTAPVTLATAVDVRWSDSATGPAKLRYSGELAACDASGDWVGIVFPAAGEDISDCQIGRTVNSPREYQGPCRWGWIESSSLKTPAG
jgi:hypothetical protein